MPGNDATYLHFTTAGNTGTVGGTGSGTTLRAVNVNTSAASAVLTIREGTSTAAIIAVVDCASRLSMFYGDLRSPNGIYAALAGGNADVTITVG